MVYSNEIMEREPHRPSRPHPWDLIPRGVIPEPLPTPKAVTAVYTYEFPEPSGIHIVGIPTARSVQAHITQPNPRDGNRFGNRT